MGSRWLSPPEGHLGVSGDVGGAGMGKVAGKQLTRIISLNFIRVDQKSFVRNVHLFFP